MLTLGTAGTAFIYGHVHSLPASVRAGQGNAADGVAAVTFILGFATVGALLGWKRPANPIGWLMSATGATYAFAAAGVLLLRSPAARVWGNWGGWLFFLSIGFVVFVLLLFPTGSLPSRRWRTVAWAAGIAMMAWALGNSFAPVSISGGSPSPLGMAGPAGRVFAFLGGVSGPLLLVAGVAAIVSLGFRYRRARAVEREQLKWLVYAGALIVAATLAVILIGFIGSGGNAVNNLQNAIGSGAVALVPIAIGVAIFRYHLYDIDVVISKTLVYGSLAVFVTGVYVAIVVGLGSLAQRGGARPSLPLSIAATAVVAIAFQPVRERVQRLANRLVYGRRATPYQVLADFAGRMAGAYAAEDLLPRMARILAEGTGATRADVWLKSGEMFQDGAAWPPGAAPLPPARATAADGPAYAGADRVLPVRYQGEMLGALSVSKRPGESLTPTEDRLIADLAAQVGLVLKNAGLREQLLARLEEIRASRQRLVAAQDSERRRIERNIHDGAQQQLVALAIKLSITESLIGTDTDGEREMLVELRQDAAGAVEDLRDLARGIYPPLLASGGLAAALEAQARKAPKPVSVIAEGVGRVRAGHRGRRLLLRPRGAAERRQVRQRHPGRGPAGRLRAGPDVRGDRRWRGFRPAQQGLRDGPAGHGGPAAGPWRDARRAVRARCWHDGHRAAALPGARGGLMTTATARWLAGGLLLLTVAALAVSAWFGVANGDLMNAFAFAPLLLAFAVVGAIVASHRPANPIGWLFLAEGLGFAVGVATDTLARHAIRDGAAPSPVAWADWLGAILGELGFLFVLAVLLFPDGRLPSRRWRVVAWVIIAGEALLVVMAVTSSAALRAENSAVRVSPVRLIPDSVADPVVNVVQTAFLPLAVAAAVGLGVRYRQATLDVRHQIKGIAVFKYRLYDIDVVISKTIVYGSLAAFITTVYVLVVVGIGSLGSGPASTGSRPGLGLSIVATAVVAVAFQPVRERVQRLANRLVYGQRATPYEALSEFAGRMGVTYAADDVLPRMARALAEGTGAARADVWLTAGSQLRAGASWPADAGPLAPVVVAGGQVPTIAGADQVRLVQYEGETLGALTVAKQPGETLTPVETRLMSDLARQAGLVLHNIGLTGQLRARLAELQASRLRIVTAQDEQRRRIERDIHDGAQQQLLAIGSTLAAAESLAGQDEERERALVAQLKAETSGALATLRELARGIYPPLLADQGLAAAVRARAGQAPGPVEVSTDGVGRYPPEIETAVYFCCVEAVQNAARHAPGSAVRVSLAGSGAEVTFSVTDDGRGFDPATATAAGTGLRNMSDRLSALGGSCQVDSCPGGGTTVTGRIRLDGQQAGNGGMVPDHEPDHEPRRAGSPASEPGPWEPAAGPGLAAQEWRRPDGGGQHDRSCAGQPPRPPRG
ncbi:MAG TPA: histidine kinase [Streptosporangiaceae bacterium]|nr:histidine kinase [Streptosporangiaceae bacterium]